MTAWRKRKPTGFFVYGVISVGDKFGVGIFHPDGTTERVKSVGLKSFDSAPQRAADRLNSRIGVTKEQAMKALKGRA